MYTPEEREQLKRIIRMYLSMDAAERERYELIGVGITYQSPKKEG